MRSWAECSLIFFFFLFFFQFVALFRGHSPLARAAAAAAIIDSPLFIAHLSMGLVMRDTRNTRYLRFYRWREFFFFSLTVSKGRANFLSTNVPQRRDWYSNSKLLLLWRVCNYVNEHDAWTLKIFRILFRYFQNIWNAILSCFSWNYDLKYS